MSISSLLFISPLGLRRRLQPRTQPRRRSGSWRLRSLSCKRIWSWRGRRAPRLRNTAGTWERNWRPSRLSWRTLWTPLQHSRSWGKKQFSILHLNVSECGHTVCSQETMTPGTNWSVGQVESLTSWAAKWKVRRSMSVRLICSKFHSNRCSCVGSTKKGLNLVCFSSHISFFVIHSLILSYQEQAWDRGRWTEEESRGRCQVPRAADGRHETKTQSGVWRAQWTAGTGQKGNAWDG